MTEQVENRAINLNSLNGEAFPITVDFSIQNGFYRIYLTPISLIEIIDLIPFETFLVFNVNSHEYEDSKSLSLNEIVSKYASYSKKFDEETLLMDKGGIIQLLNEISHYNFCLIDSTPEIEIDKVIQIIDLADKWKKIIVIEEVCSNVFLSSHDDCYLYIETNDKTLALDLISLQIKILVATVSDCPIYNLNFNPKDLITQESFSIVIPQNPIKTTDKVAWKIFGGTFKDCVYKDQIVESKNSLIYLEAEKTIKIEKVRSLSTSD